MTTPAIPIGKPAKSPRQTLSYLQSLLEARGLRPNSKLGQCFLVDLNLMDLLVKSAELTLQDLVLEVGCGTGSLTARLGEQAGAVLGIEIDPGMAALARDFTAHLANVRLLQIDALKRKNQLHPDLLQNLEEGMHKGSFRQIKLVANLPYVIATPLIANLLLTDLPIERMVITVQWELAERLAANPSTPDYGSLAVFVQSLADVTILRQLAPSVFWPRPKVSSGIVLVRPNAEKRKQLGDRFAFHEFLHHLYLHRRKNLRGALLPHPWVADRWNKQELDQRLLQHDFNPQTRAEALTVEQHQKLCRALLPPQA